RSVASCQANSCGMKSASPTLGPERPSKGAADPACRGSSSSCSSGGGHPEIAFVPIAGSAGRRRSRPDPPRVGRWPSQGSLTTSTRISLPSDQDVNQAHRDSYHPISIVNGAKVEGTQSSRS
ncbi:unnamed protein product, partial [Laminaria digitata]